MNNKRLMAALLGTGLFLTQAVSAVETSEIEKGNTITDSQTLNAGDAMTVSGAVMEALNAGAIEAKDVDFYSFYGNAGDEVMIRIENALGGTDLVHILNLALFRPQSEGYGMEILAKGTNTAEPVISGNDPSTGWTLQRSGYYIVGIVSYPRQFTGDTGAVHDPNFGPYAGAAGDYDLVVSFTNKVPQEPVPEPTPEPTEDPAPEEPGEYLPMPVEIVIKPGNNSDWAPINPASKGKIPVAILSTPGMNAVTEVVIDSLTFGSTGLENSLHKCNKQDVNSDGRLDLKCNFYNQAANFGYDDVVGKLNGKLKDGTEIEAMAPLKVLSHVRNNARKRR